MRATEAGRELGSALQRAGIAGEVRTDLLSRLLYATDASNYKIVPDAVLAAERLEDLQIAVATCHELGIPLTPRGAGTSLAGQSVGTGLHVDTYRLERITIDADARTAEVWCGTVQRHLDDEAARHGLTFGPDTATANRATIGGMVGNNSAGTRSVVYGMTRDRLGWAEAVMADGSVVRFGQTDERGAVASGISGVDPAATERLAAGLDHVRRLAGPAVAERYPKILRHVDGYGLDELCSERPNLARFLAGSEGTLAMFTRFGVALDHRPAERALAVLAFGDLERALEQVPELLSLGPSAIEMLDAETIAGTPQADELIAGGEAVLYVEFQGDAGEATARLGALPELGAVAVTRINELAAQRLAWAIRERGLGATMAVGEPGLVPSFVEDTAVPPARMSEYVREVKRVVASYGTRTVMFGHASVGCLHMHPLIDVRTTDGIRDMAAMGAEIVDLVRDFDGAISGEHGNGLARSGWLERYFGAELVDRFREIKRTFDPTNILNPGKIVDAPPMTANLRFGSDYQVRSGVTPLDFSDQAGFAAATELCFGAGACKKSGAGGAMCPPAMVTRDERHATRARANALRAVLEGDLPVTSLAEPEFRDVMDLCIGCKACKSECPVGVDMARLKTDWLWRVRKLGGTPLRAKALANLRRLSALASLAPGVANAAADSATARRLMERAGVAPQRSLPRIARRRFSRFVRRAHRPDVAIFADCFTEFQEPEVGLALVKLLAAGGRRATVPRTGCCGRTMLSQGMVEEARRSAQSTAATLLPLAERRLPILFLEPSCLSMVRDDWRHLLPDDPAVQAVAAAARSAEETMAELDPPWLSPGEHVLLQGHCHQTALWGTGATEAALSMVPGTQTEVLDAGCCGMAGGFGYEAGHYDLSVAMGERVLAPAIRSNAGATIVATGTSCRHQIRDLTGREALHPVEYLARHLR